MAYPYFTAPSPRYHPAATPYGPGHHPTFHFHSPSPSPAPRPSHPYYHYHPHATPAYPSSDYDDYPDVAAAAFEDEEAAALAHLRAIQRRKQAAAAAAAEAQAQAQAQAELRARAKAHAQAKQEALARIALQRRQEQEEELVAQQVKRARLARIAQAQAEAREKEQAIRQQAFAKAVQQQIEQQQRQYELQQQQERHQREIAFAKAQAEAARRAQIEACHRARSQAPAQTQAQAGSCARRCGNKVEGEKKDEGKSSRDEMQALNNFLAMFGFQFEDDKAEEQKNEQKVEDKASAPASATTVPTPAKDESARATESDKSAEAKTTEPAQKQSPFPESINDLLSHFLGLRVEPESESGSTATPAEEGVPAGLNDFLSQFGLEFVPDHIEVKKTDKKAESSSSAVKEAAKPETDEKKVDFAPLSTTDVKPSASASSSTSTKKDQSNSTPLTDFLNGVSDLPPFVRDILGNVELAFKEQGKQAENEEKEVQGKGKGVAEGEKTERPVPIPSTPAPTTDKASSKPAPAPTPSALSKLDSIAHELHLATQSFTFPSTLSFSSTPSPSETENGPTPALLYNRLNKPYHAQSNKLLQLLLEADSVSSNGDKSIRNRRKELVKEVEKALEELEKRRDEVWGEVKLRREQEGGESEDEGWSTSSAASERHEEKTIAVKENKPEGEAGEVKQLATDIKEGYDKINTTYAEAASHSPSTEVDTQPYEPVVPQSTPDKVEGYEIEQETEKQKEVEHVENAGSASQAVETVDESTEQKSPAVEGVEKGKAVEHKQKEGEAEEGYELL